MVVAISSCGGDNTPPQSSSLDGSSFSSSLSSEISIPDEEKVFTITYALDGGVVEVPNPTSYTIQTETFTLNNPTKLNCYFQGWSSNLFSGVKQTVTVEKGTKGDLYFAAKFQYVGEITYFNGANVSLLPTPVKTLMDAKDENEVAKHLYEYNQHYRQAQTGQPLTIDFPNINQSPEVSVELYRDEEMSDLAYSKIYTNEQGSSSGSATFYNLIPNQKYFVKVTDKEENVLKTDSFFIEDKMRFIYAGNVTNMRDMGGKTTDNGVTPYGKVYRAADVSEGKVNNTGIDILANQLGIKTEIDLRLDTPAEASCSPSINLVNCGYWHNDYIFPGFNSNRPFSQTYATNLKRAFLLFTDAKNYPIVFHCSAGADRTGTFAFLLDGLLGVDYETLCRDFETTSFYMGRRWRSSIEVNDGVYSFSPSGVMQDDADNLVAFGRMYNHMIAEYGSEGGTLSEAVENYMKTVLAMEQGQIDAIKHVLLGVGDHHFGEWEISQRPQCQTNGLKVRYCACGEKEEEVIVNNGHYFSEWEVTKEPTEDEDGTKERHCTCGLNETETIPHHIKTVYDFDGVSFSTNVTTDAIKSLVKATKLSDKSSLPEGYEGEVYGASSDYLVCTGVNFPTPVDASKSFYLKLRMIVQSETALPKGNFRLYNATDNSILTDNMYSSFGSLNSWIEIDLLPILNRANLIVNNIIQPFTIVLRTGVNASVSFDSIIHLQRGE